MSLKNAARYMLEQLQEHGELRQDDAAMQLEAKFGEEAIYYNKHGNLAILPGVLSEFRKLTPDAVWMKRSRYWKMREPGDEPGREQPY